MTHELTPKEREAFEKWWNTHFTDSDYTDSEKSYAYRDCQTAFAAGLACAAQADAPLVEALERWLSWHGYAPTVSSSADDEGTILARHTEKLLAAIPLAGKK
ncbi:MAG: hypothetical protein AAB864_01670 [Patescibacteria group bacterium]